MSHKHRDIYRLIVSTCSNPEREQVHGAMWSINFLYNRDQEDVIIHKHSSPTKQSSFVAKLVGHASIWPNGKMLGHRRLDVTESGTHRCFLCRVRSCLRPPNPLISVHRRNRANLRKNQIGHPPLLHLKAHVTH